MCCAFATGPGEPLQGILLAAGNARRFGSDKLAARLPDGDFVVAAAARALIKVTPNVLAVVRSGDSGAACVLRGLDIPLLVAPEAGRGMGASLAAAVRHTPGARGWLVALGDMPYLSPRSVHAVSRAVTAPENIALPIHRGRPGHPVAFGSAYRDALCTLDGDTGARRIVQENAKRVIRVECADTGIFRDIDRPDDLR